MTPQLRQAIKLLQFTNLEAAAFVEEELERNPLLERDERPDAAPELPAPDQRAERLEAAWTPPRCSRTEKLPDAVEADHSNSFDHGRRRRTACHAEPPMPPRHGGGRDPSDERGIDDLAEAPRNLRTHLGEQLRLSFADPRGPA